MKIIDADKLREEIAERTFNSSSRLAVRVRDKILKIIDEQPEIKAPFKAVTEIKIDKDQLKEITKQAIDEMKSQMLVSLPNSGEWIPAKSKFPPKGEDVLVTEDGGAISIATFDGRSYENAWHGDDFGYSLSEIIAWRPLPKPYREDDDK